MPQTSVNINNMIRDEIGRAVGEVDVWDVAHRIVASLDDDELRAALVNLMADRVRRVYGNARRLGMTPGPYGTPAKTPAPAQGTSRRSVAVAAWRLKLNDLVVPIEGKATPKRLGECTTAEVLMLATAYRRRSAELAAQGEWYLRIAEAMQATKVRRVADLPESTLRPLLSKVAA